MDAPNLAQPSVWADVAAELEKIAADCRDLIGQPAPLRFDIDIHTHRPASFPPAVAERAQTVAGVDTVGQILVGRSGFTHALSGSGDRFRHTAEGARGPIILTISQAVADPALVDPVEELARLRAENEALRAELTRPAPCGGECTREAGHLGEHHLADPTGITYGRGDEGQAPQQIGARVPAHTGALTEAGLAEIPMAASGLTVTADQLRGPLAGMTPVVTYFSFGHGQTDPDNGQSLLDHYVTVVAPTYDGCREAMFGSRFGRAWSFDYLAGTARASEWIPRWTEHEVIVAEGTDQSQADEALAAAEALLVKAAG